MSMHFAPQWVKPIKPTGSTLGNGGNDSQQQPQQSKTSAASVLSNSPFPALGQPRSGSPNAASIPPLSYSRATHTQTSPSTQGDSYYPYAGEGQNGGAEPNPFPFRYSREQILAIWDESKVKERPIELMKMAESEGGSVLVSKGLVRPVGLRDLTENEKRILSTTIHPPMPNRRQPTHGNAHAHGGRADANQDLSVSQRRGPAPPKDAGLPAQPSGDRRAGPFAGFGRGEGGAFGGVGAAKFGNNPLPESREGRQPGSLGGGFGGVGKRGTRRDADDPTRPSAASTWRPTRNASGTFEGVLGFGGSGSAPAPSQPMPSETDSNGKSADRAGWGSAEKQWRAGPDDRPLSISTDAASSVSVIATASATPVAERDALIRGETPTPSANGQPGTPTAQEREDLGALNWYYRDPNGQEQGPFTGSQMHEWYSHSYFKDDLPVRREQETGFHTLSELKVNTGNAVQPFLSPVRPRLPPNLPIPHAALQSGVVASPGGLSDSFRHMGIHGPAQPIQNQYHSPSPVAPYPGHFGQAPFAAQPFGQPQWSPAPGPQSPARMNPAYGSIGASPYSPFGAAPIGTPVQQRAPDVFSPAIGQPSPWGAPAPVNPAAAWQQQQQQQQMPPQQPSYSVPPPQQQQQLEAEPASFFPPTEEITEEQIAPTEPVQKEEPQQEQEVDVAESEDDAEAVEDSLEPEPKPVASAWGKNKATESASRKSSITTPTATKATPSTSLPAKPAAPVEEEYAEEEDEEEEDDEHVVVEEKAAPAPKPAPWADSKPAPAGPSLREIQEAEARQAAASRQARAAARAAASPAPSTPADDIPAVMSWGLPTSSKGVPSPAPVASSTPAAAWGGSSDGPKKTLKQIQEEEEKRREKAHKQTQAASAAVSASTPIQKRGYADLAAHTPPPSSVPGWTTVGAGGKASPALKPASPAVAKPAAAVVAAPKPVVPAVVKAAPKPPTSDEPSMEFVRWAKQALTGLQVPVDDFITMLLQFPIDPPASSKSEVQEIIADSVYASSRTLDGRRFAQEFMTRRKADVARPPVAGKKTNSIADIVKAQPKPPAADLGFKVVKAKKKRQA